MCIVRVLFANRKSARLEFGQKVSLWFKELDAMINYTYLYFFKLIFKTPVDLS